jgi:hypothetical protein
MMREQVQSIGIFGAIRFSSMSLPWTRHGLASSFQVSKIFVLVDFGEMEFSSMPSPFRHTMTWYMMRGKVLVFLVR